MRKRIISLFMVMVMILSVTACGTTGKGNDSSQKIVVFNYGDYIETSLLDKFEKETGIKVVYDEYLMPEAMYTKYVNKTVDYDLICCSDYMLDKMIKEKDVKKIDYSKMKYYKNIGSKYIDFAKNFDPQNEYSVPYYWGTVGILYNTKSVKKAPDSWDDLWNAKYKNEIIMQDSVRDSFIPALKKLGLSLNTTDDKELESAKELLLQQKSIVQSYLVDEVRDDMANEQAKMALIYSGEASLAQDYNDHLDYVIPKEGSNIWMDAWVMPKEGKNYEGAIKFLDFLCREDVAMDNFEYVYYSTPNQAVLDALPADEKENTTIFPTDESLKKCEVFKYLGRDAEEKYNYMWKELKAY